MSIKARPKPLLVLKKFFFFCSNIELKAPFNMEEGKRELHFTYLDTVGRPVVVAHKTNLVEQHIQDFEVKADCDCIIIIVYSVGGSKLPLSVYLFLCLL